MFIGATSLIVTLVLLSSPIIKSKENCEGPPLSLIFPTLTSNTVIANDISRIEVPFMFEKMCNSSPSSDAFDIQVKKEVEQYSDRCLFIYQRGKCVSNNKQMCQCPTGNLSIYTFELTADESVTGTYTWSSEFSSTIPFEEKSLQIVFEGNDDASTEETITKTKTVKHQTADASDKRVTSSSAGDPAEIKPSDDRYEAAFFLSPPGIIILTFNGIIIVSVISLVIVVVKRRGRRLRLSSQRDIPLQELQQGRHQLVPPLAHQQRQLPDIPGQQHVPPQCPTPLVLMRSRPGGRQYRSQESNFYEIIDDDERNDEGVRASASAPDLRALNQCADYLHPIPSRQEAAEARAKNPHYENRPLYENYFHPWNVETEPHQ